MYTKYYTDFIEPLQPKSADTIYKIRRCFLGGLPSAAGKKFTFDTLYTGGGLCYNNSDRPTGRSVGIEGERIYAKMQR